MADYVINGQTLTDIADAVRAGFGIVSQDHPVINSTFVNEDEGDSGSLNSDMIT